MFVGGVCGACGVCVVGAVAVVVVVVLVGVGVVVLKPIAEFPSYSLALSLSLVLLSP